MKYEINEETMAIIPVDANNSKVLELRNEYVVPEPSFQIMEENCEYYGSTYDGRVKAAKKILNFSYKLPLIIEESEKIIFFPTKASTSNDCVWINHSFVEKRIKSGNNTKVIFKNGTELEFNISKLSFENQLLRAGMLASTISKRIKQR